MTTQNENLVLSYHNIEGYDHTVNETGPNIRYYSSFFNEGDNRKIVQIKLKMSDIISLNKESIKHAEEMIEYFTSEYENSESSERKGHFMDNINEFNRVIEDLENYNSESSERKGRLIANINAFNRVIEDLENYNSESSERRGRLMANINAFNRVIEDLENYNSELENNGLN